MHIPPGQDGQRQPRGQSSPIALLLVFAIVIAATTLIVALGAGSIDSTQQTLDSERTENTMTQLDSQAAMVALGESNSQRVDISAPGSGGYVVNDTAGRMTLSYENQTSGTTTTIFSQEMGSITYEGEGESTIAYQGGGVWRSDGSGGSVMVSPPEFHYRDATLTLPLVVVNSSGTIGDRAVISQDSNVQRFPNTTADGNFTNPLENARVEVTVTSEYYRAWGAYFETRTEGVVEYDDANNQVTLDLVTPLENTRITSATSSLSASGAFEINGAAASVCASGRTNYTDSYNSSGTDDGYCDQVPGNNGDLVYGADIDISEGSGGDDIRGDVTSGASVNVTNSGGGGQPEVYGNISYTNNCNPSVSDCEDRIQTSTGTVSQISGIDEASAINGLVRSEIDEIESDPDTTSNITSSDTLDYDTDDTVELHAGDYYLERIDVPSDHTVLLNTTEGNITLAVEENVALNNDATINVTGDGSVDVYVQSAGGNARQFDMDESSSVENHGDDATQFRMFGPDNFTAVLGDGNNNLANYTGIIYSPPGTIGSSSVTLDGAAVYGGLLTGTTEIAGRGSIHYDEALQNEQVLSRDASVVRVTYIHASTNNITVEEG